MADEPMPLESKSAWVRQHMNGAVTSEVVFRNEHYEANAGLPTESEEADQAHRRSFPHLDEARLHADEAARILRPHSCGAPACTDWEPFAN